MSINISEIKNGQRCKLIYKGNEIEAVKVVFNHFKWISDKLGIVYLYPYEIEILEVIDEPT